MTADWSRLEAALERRRPTVWWRDDDAVAPSPQLERLLALTESCGASVTLAVIPAPASDALASALEDRDVTVAVHGWKHHNHAPQTDKKAEFGTHRPLEALVKDAANGKQRIDELFGTAALPLFVPPWNRMAAELSDELAKIGFEAVSTYAQRMISANGLVRFDTHIDPIDWRGSRSAVSAQTLIDHVTGLLESDEPIGLMTHHRVHDPVIWSLIEDLTQRLTRYRARWVSADTLIRRGATGANV